jgi:hypothetical protein
MYSVNTNNSQNFLFTQDTPCIRDYLTETLGKPEEITNDYCYIIIDKHTLSWRTTYIDEWLERESPPLSSLEDIDTFLLETC